MSKYVVKAIIFCILFISASSLIGLQEYAPAQEIVEEVKPVEVSLEPIPEIVFSDSEVQPGGYMGIYIKGITERDEIKVSTDLVKDQPSFFKHLEGKLTIVGLNSRVKAGDYKYLVQVYRDGEPAAEREETVKVLPKEFEKQYLTVTTTQKEQRSDNNFDSDKVYTDKAKSDTAERPLWEGAFIKPVEGRISTGFAMTRFINKVESGRHSGLDIAAAKGTPVKASNNGIVRLAMMLKVTGNTVIIDHGCNIYSSYAHLDKLLVNEGDEVKQGDIIGEVGSTGFSTGPHLHWTTTVGTVFINPEALMEKDMQSFTR